MIRTEHTTRNLQSVSRITQAPYQCNYLRSPKTKPRYSRRRGWCQPVFHILLLYSYSHPSSRGVVGSPALAEFLVLSHVQVPFTFRSIHLLFSRKLSLLIPNTKSSTTTCPRRKRIGRNDDGSGLLASRGVRILGCAAVDTICFSHVWKHSLLVKKIQIQLIRDRADSKYVS